MIVSHFFLDCRVSRMWLRDFPHLPVLVTEITAYKKELDLRWNARSSMVKTNPRDDVCPTKRRLGEEFADAAQSYHEAVVRLTQKSADDAESERANAAVREAHLRVNAARVAFEEHLDEHAC